MNNEQITRAANAALITSTAIETARDRAREHGQPEPSAQDILEGLDKITAWFEDGPATDQRANRAVDLVEVLLNDHEDLAGELMEASAQDHPDETRRLAEQLVRSGAVNADTSFPEGQRLFEEAQNNAANGAD